MPYEQWAELPEGSGYTPAGRTTPELKPGYYDMDVTAGGQLFFIPVRARKDELLHFPDSASLQVLEGITNFWDREELFKRYGLPFKRGILLYGPPGSGKTCTLQLVSREVVQRGGVVITYNPALFLMGYRALRDIQPEIPVVVLMEDFETWMTHSSKEQSRLLNLLDGVEALHKVVFLATTNYPEMLQDRVVNRPSRFDIRVHVGHPQAEARKLYLESLIAEGDEVNIKQYVEDTQGMSLAHVKELFVATHILGSPYRETVERLKKMMQKISSGDDYEIGGFL